MKTFVRVMTYVGLVAAGYYLGRYVERTHAQMNRTPDDSVDAEPVDSDEE